jgi:hypothetical protein
MARPHADARFIPGGGERAIAAGFTVMPEDDAPAARTRADTVQALEPE